jgi:hypothetical protein
VPLFVNQNNLYTEQAYNRMIRTIAMVASIINMPIDTDVCYQSCTIIDNTLIDVRGYFTTWVNRHAIYDALLATGVSATT